MTLHFIDAHSVYQKDLKARRVKKEGWDAVVIKVSEGTGFVPAGLKRFVRRFKALNVFTRLVDGVKKVFRREGSGETVIGYYHFLTDADGDRQAAHFMRQVNRLGGPEGRLLVVDFEANGPSPGKTATNRALREFVAGVKRRTNGHPVILYSGYGFWTSGDSSGNPDDYGVAGTWDARYADMKFHPNPKAYWKSVAPWYWRQPKWDNKDDLLAVQYTSKGKVANYWMDCNVFFGTMADLQKLTHAPKKRPDGGPATGEPDGPPRPAPKPEDNMTRLERNIKEVKQYGLNLLDHHPKYWCWDGGSLTRLWVNGRPGCRDTKPPPMRKINRIFCADLITLQLRKIGKPVPKNSIWPGGTRSFQLKYGSKMKRLTDLSKLQEGDVVFVDFGTRHAPEGHIGFCLGDGPNGRLLQSYADSCATSEPGLTAKWTVKESHAGFFYTHYIPREVIWG